MDHRRPLHTALALPGIARALTFEQWLGGDNCKNADLASLKLKAQQKRAVAIASGDDAALSYALKLFLLPTLAIGGLFAALGWISAGFRRRAA